MVARIDRLVKSQPDVTIPPVSVTALSLWVLEGVPNYSVDGSRSTHYHLIRAPRSHTPPSAEFTRAPAKYLSLWAELYHIDYRYRCRVACLRRQVFEPS
jgi:hypothetical protein